MKINFFSKDLKKEVLDCIKNKKPLFMLRMGDGEMILEKEDINKLIFFSKKQINRELTKKEILLTKTNMSEAVVKSTILGLPTERHINNNALWSYLMDYYKTIFKKNRIDLHSKKYCSIDFHYEILKDGTIFEIFSEIDNLVIVSCRDIVPNIKKKYPNIKNIEFYSIPGEQAYELNKNIEINIFEEIDKISLMLKQKDRKGQLMIFGAGPFGKHLGADFYKMGGVSLDLGSVFDLFVGKITRGKNKGVNSFQKPLL